VFVLAARRHRNSQPGRLRSQVHGKPSFLFEMLEDPDFEREFDAFGDDEVEARYILTPALMARILALKRPGGQVALSFLNGQVHVALGVARDLFEPSVFTRVSDARQVAGFLNDLRSILGIIEALNLNTRLWSRS